MRACAVLGLGVGTVTFALLGGSTCGGREPARPRPETPSPPAVTAPEPEEPPAAPSTPTASATPTTTATASAAPPPPNSAGCSKEKAAGTTPRTLVVQGKNRSFVLVVPRGYDRTRPHPLVFGFHGDGGSGAQIRTALGLERAAKEPTIFVYPDAIGDGFDLNEAPEKNPDVAFFDAALANVMDEYCVSRARVMLTGYSRGAYMVNQLACWRGGVLRGVAPQAGGGPYDATGKSYDDQGRLLCPGMGPVSALIVHGQKDTNVKFSETNDTLAFYRTRGRCGAPEKSSPDPCVAHACADGRHLGLCAIPTLGHGVWPKAAATVMDFFATLK